MKAKELIHLIRTTDDEHATMLLEGLFKFGFVYGIKKGYINIAEIMRKKAPLSDSDEANEIWGKHFR